MSQSVLAIIPARGGSKGVLRKNVRDVAGLPLIAYTIEAAAASRSVSRVVTTTDDAEIAEVAARFGSGVIRRPADLAEDDTPMLPVVEHAVAAVEREAGPFDYVALLQPTTPLRTARHIDECLEKLVASGKRSIVSVYEVGDAHPARMYREVDGLLVPYETEPENRLRQKLAPVYHRNGAVYAFSRSLLAEDRLLLEPRPLPYLMRREDSVNIDDEFDLLVADLLLRHRGKAGGSRA
jgi:CMP-N,N'-diacetyllegionaminic acid synthase